MPFMIMEHATEPKQKLLDDIGDVSAFEIFNNQILLDTLRILPVSLLEITHSSIL